MRRAILLYWLLLSSLVSWAQSGIRQIEQHSTLFTLRALDERTKTEVPARYQVKAILSKMSFSAQSAPGSRFSFSLKRTDTLVVSTTAKGYYTVEEVLFVPCDTCAEYEHVAFLEKEAPKEPDGVFHDLKVADKIRLDNVYFDQSSYVLRPESYPQLDKLARTLQVYPALQIEIAGHTDNVGDRRLNQLLSENRASVIANYLINHGIASKRLAHQGYGDTRPAAPNDNEVNKKQNRRVEFVVLAK